MGLAQFCMCGEINLPPAALTAELPDLGGERRVLVLFSDMWSSTKELNLESSRGQHTSPPLIGFGRAEMIYALGVDGAGLPTTRWHDIEQFWTSYLHDSSASLKPFSVLRSMPEQK
jgi:hypothetical protein